MKKKRPLLAGFLSFFIVGLGQLYNGQTKKAFIMFVLAVGLGVMSYSFGWFVIAVWSAIDAYCVAEKTHYSRT